MESWKSEVVKKPVEIFLAAPMVVSRSLLCRSGRLLHVRDLDGRNGLRNLCKAFHSLAVGLTLLRAVNAVESDALRVLVVQNFESVAVVHRVLRATEHG
jgi:hypothetical protein